MTAEAIRLDKWLWQARFFKSRSLSANQIEEGRVRLNGEIVRKTAQPLRPGDVLTFLQGSEVRLIRVCALGVRRGPAPEARSLYQDLDEIAPAATAPAATGPDASAGAASPSPSPSNDPSVQGGDSAA